MGRSNKKGRNGVLFKLESELVKRVKMTMDMEN